MNKSLLIIFLLIVYQANTNGQSLKPTQPQLLDSMTRVIGNNEYTGINSVLISKAGQPVYEHYFNGWQKDSLHDSRSSFKSMESGFDCEEFNEDKDCESEMVKAKDWVRFSLELPMKNTPGTVWAYTSCNPDIVGGIISHAAKMSIMDFAKKYLFDPLGITDYRWTQDSLGQATIAGSLHKETIIPGRQKETLIF